jgi:hypothetical protein
MVLLHPRYNGPGHTWNGQTEATVILIPHRTLYLPHTQPTIRGVSGPC